MNERQTEYLAGLLETHLDEVLSIVRMTDYISCVRAYLATMNKFTEKPKYASPILLHDYPYKDCRPICEPIDKYLTELFSEAIIKLLNEDDDPIIVVSAFPTVAYRFFEHYRLDYKMKSGKRIYDEMMDKNIIGIWSAQLEMTSDISDYTKWPKWATVEELDRYFSIREKPLQIKEDDFMFLEKVTKNDNFDFIDLHSN